MYLEIFKKLLHKKNLRLSQLNEIQKNVILIGSIYNLIYGHEYEEASFNQILDDYCILISQTFIIDRAELRRTLVDDMFMKRTRDCKIYWLNELTSIKSEIKINLMNYDLNAEIQLTYEKISQEKKFRKEKWLNEVM